MGSYKSVILRPARPCLKVLGRNKRTANLLNRLAPARGVYETFEEAQRAAENLALGGHEDPTLSEIHSRTLRESDYPVVHWLRSIDARRIFDFGGSTGSLYYLYRDQLTPPPQEWVVYDLPCVVARGEQLAASRAARNLRFTSALAEGSGCEVLLISGALHFWPKPVSCLFEEMAALPPHVLINRSPLTERASYAIVHGLPKIAVPAWVRNARELIAEMEALGYTLTDRWLEPSRSLSFPLFPEHSISAYSGLYFRRNSVTHNC